MLLNLRKNILKNILLTASGVFVASASLLRVTELLAINSSTLLWLLVLALGIALALAWRSLLQMKARTLASLKNTFSYQHVMRAPDDGINWRVLDDYAAQLAARKYVCVGDFCVYPASTRLAGVACCLIDEAQSTIIEMQFLTTLQESMAGDAQRMDGVHFSITSAIGGKIRVTTTDHFAVAAHYLLRGETAVFASHPDCDLLELLDKHERLLRKLQQKLGKAVSRGMNIERYILLTRESRQQAFMRLSRMGPLEYMQEVEHFEATFPNKWAAPSSQLKDLPNVSLERLDKSELAQGQAPIMPAKQQSL